jgi:long-chain acyl-CoA synthetase
MCSAWLGGKEGEEVFLGALPFFHIYGVTTALHAPIYLAGTLIPIIDPGSVESVLGAIQKHRVTVFCGVPTMYLLLINYSDIGRYNLSSVRYCLSGAAPLPPEVQRRFMELTGGVLIEGYGLTEASPVTHANPLDKSMKTVKIGSIGLTWPDTKAKIVNSETGKELGVGEIGELVIKGPQVMKSYWKMPKETNDVLKEGWLYTGDIARVDEDGFFYIEDRKKDLIKYMGYSVYPREVEDVLYEHPAVRLCAVIGKPDEKAGEIPMAYIVLKEGTTATEEELINFVRERIASYKRIRIVEFREQLPLTMTGKVLKRTLRDELVKEA